MSTKTENTPEIIKLLLNKLDEFGIKYEYDEEGHRVKIKGYIGYTIADICGFDFFHDEDKVLSISVKNRKEGIELMIAELKNFRHFEITLPRKTFVSFEKGYLRINFFQ
jgi:hypothetical protein